MVVLLSLYNDSAT